MKKGDVFYVHNLGKTLAYKVDQIKVIKTTQVDQLKIVKGKDLCTWIPYNPKAEAKAKERIRNRLFWIIIAILLPVLAIITIRRPLATIQYGIADAMSSA